jgi:hypothetical protein
MEKSRMILIMLYFIRVTLLKMTVYQWMPACDRSAVTCHFLGIVAMQMAPAECSGWQQLMST